MPDGKNFSSTSLPGGQQQIRSEIMHSVQNKPGTSPRDMNFLSTRKNTTFALRLHYETKSIASDTTLDLDESTDAESEYHEALNDFGPELNKEDDQNEEDDLSNHALESNSSKVKVTTKF
jgi:hypothetical protein